MDNLQILREAAVVEAAESTEFYKLLLREAAALRDSYILMSAQSQWHATVASLKASALFDLTNSFSAIKDARDAIVAAEMEAASQPKTSAGDAEYTRRRPQAV